MPANGSSSRMNLRIGREAAGDLDAAALAARESVAAGPSDVLDAEFFKQFSSRSSRS